jgi:hypothetical protein
MASTFSPLLRIELIGAGEQAGAWNNTTNTNLGTLLEQAIAGSTSVSLSSAAYDLGGSAAIANGASDVQRNMAITFTGTPGADAVITIPATSKLYVFKNSTTGIFALKIKTSSQLLANAITVPNGRTMIVGCDGTNAVNAIDSLSAGSTIGSDVIATVTGTETLTNKTLTAPKFADNGFISDPHANPMLAFDTLASALLAGGSGSLSVSNGPSALATTGASGSGTTATVTYTAANSTQIPVGAAVTIGGVNPAGYNGTYTVTASSVGSVSYANTTTATYVSAGTVSVEPAIAATGTNSNIDINLVPKGSGAVSVTGNLRVTGSQTVSGGQTISGSQVISVTDNANAALRITQLGTGNAILVEDSTNPDATPFVVTADGNVGVGLTNPSVQLQVVGTAQDRLWLGGAATTNRQLFVRSNGTFAAPTVVASGDAVGSANFFGYDGTANIELASIAAAVDGTPGTNDMPGRLTFSTTADGAAAPTERFRIGNAGQLGIGGATYGTAGQVLTSGGASAAPSWATLAPITLGTAVTASGTSVPFTGIPAGVKRITMNFGNVSSTGTQQVQLGTSSGYITTGYLSSSSTDGGTSNSTTGFVIREAGSGGSMVLTQISPTLWAGSHGIRGCGGGGSVTISGTIDSIRLININTSDTFSGGTLNIMYE